MKNLLGTIFLLLCSTILLGQTTLVTGAYYGHADPLYGDIDPPIGNWIKEFDSMTILPFFS